MLLAIGRVCLPASLNSACASLRPPAPQCPKCLFVFCSLCMEGWHPGERAGREGRGADGVGNAERSRFLSRDCSRHTSAATRAHLLRARWPAPPRPAGTQCVSAETKLAMLRRKMAGGGRAAVEELRRQEQELLSVAQIEVGRAGGAGAGAGARDACAFLQVAPVPAPPRSPRSPNAHSTSLHARTQKMAKKCPRCGMATQKAEGCNKMACGGCGAYWCGAPRPSAPALLPAPLAYRAPAPAPAPVSAAPTSLTCAHAHAHDPAPPLPPGRPPPRPLTGRCWRCGKEIDGYRHFRTGECILFDEAEILR